VKKSLSVDGAGRVEAAGRGLRRVARPVRPPYGRPPDRFPDPGPRYPV